ncbi:hypothetical protein LMG9964_06248 [Paraburkholderia phenoliruptrix]|uniref:Uncharacterized protein n=2 Tax=Paraburkholderia phenoliruptrix TaxID=252970 RepID=K0DZ10_9BURK|nr:hypothetical protein BUPH_08361 [Paraburkholderia phenoliruptrix BR3459a]CAB4052558.1 hypothetical protein LMG9964_06248 [Paraburkholderia phenoliruptrix]
MRLRSSVELEYQLSATRSVRIDNLRFPFPLRWRAVRGRFRLSTARNAGDTTRSEVRLRAEQLFDICMTPDSSGAVTTNLAIDFGPFRPRLEPDWDELGRVYPYSRGFGLALVRSMFQSPYFPWDLRETAWALRTPPRSLQMTLFREGYSFDAALRRCRQLNTLLEKGDTMTGLSAVCVGREAPGIWKKESDNGRGYGVSPKSGAVALFASASGVEA